jgi:hypothetical protein
MPVGAFTPEIIQALDHVADRITQGRQQGGTMGMGGDIVSRGRERLESSRMSSTQKAALRSFTKNIEDSGSSFAKAMVKNVETLKDAEKAWSKIARAEAVVGLIDKFGKGKIAFEKLEQTMEDMGVEAEEFGDTVTNLNKFYHTTEERQAAAAKATEQLTKEIKEADKAVLKFAKDMDRKVVPGIMDGIKGFFKKFGGRAAMASFGLLGKELLEATRAAAKFGGTIQVQEALMRGMVPAELIELQNRHRQSILGLGGSYDDHLALLDEQQLRLVRLTGGLKEATEAAAEIVSTHRRLGVADTNVSGFLEQQTNLFEDLNRTIGMTSEQFKEMNASITSDVDIRSVMVRLQEKDRVQYFQQLQQQISYLRVQKGLGDAAEGVVKQFEQLRGEGPKDRLRKAAMMRMTMGAMGMGAEGNELFNIVRKGAAATPQERERQAELELKAAEKSTKIMRDNAGKAGEFMMHGMLEKGGLLERWGPKSVQGQAELYVGTAMKAEAGARIRAYTVMSEMPDFMQKHLENWDKGLVYWDRFYTFMRGPYMGAIGGILFGVAKIATLSKTGIGGFAGYGGVGKNPMVRAATSIGGAAVAITALSLSMGQLGQAIMTGESDTSKAIQESGRYGELLHNIWGDWIGGVISVMTLDLQGALFAWKDAGDNISKFFGRGEKEEAADARHKKVMEEAALLQNELQKIANMHGEEQKIAMAAFREEQRKTREATEKTNELAEDQIAVNKTAVRYGRQVANAAPT